MIRLEFPGQLLRIPGPGAGLTSAVAGVVPQLLVACIDQLDTKLQRGVNRVVGFLCKPGEAVNTTQPVTFLFQATVVTLVAGTIKELVVRAIFETDIFQHEQPRIGESLN